MTSFEICLPFVIRPCQERDLPALEWFGKFAEHRALIREAFDRQLAGEVTMLLAVTREFPGGQIWIDFTRRADDGVAYFWALRVFPLFRGQGIGRRLIREALEAAARRGFPWAELGVERGNTGARRLYERLGFEPVREVVETYSYRKPDGSLVHARADQVIMRRATVAAPVRK